MSGLIRFFVRRRLFANLFTFLIIFFGLVAAFNAKREAFPAVDFDVVTVMTVWPGASPSEVERLVTIPIEQDLDGVDGIKTMGSVSVENRSVIIMELDPDLSRDDKDETIDDVQTVVNQLRDLPTDAETPLVSEQTSDSFPILELSLSGPDERVVRDQVKKLEDELLRLREVSAIAKRGWRERQFLVEVLPENLEKFHVSLPEIATAISGRNVNIPGGSLKAAGDEWLVRSVGEYKEAKDIEPVIIRANDYGRLVQVEDVIGPEGVRDGFEELTVINRSRGQRSIDMVVIKKGSADIIKTVDGVRAIVAEFENALPDGYEISFMDDVSYFVRRRLGILINNAFVGLTFVIIALLIFLSPRVSFWTSLGIPFSMLAALLAMQFIGIPINLISMMGFIIVIGMLVDDAIVVAENVHRHREAGLSMEEASVKGGAEVAGPVAGSILTTMAAFLPLAFMGGIFGKFVWAIPVVVCLSLAASWIESMIALPAHLSHRSSILQRIRDRLGVTRPQREKKEPRFRKFSNWYADTFTASAVRLRYLVAGAVVLVVIFAGLLASRMKVQLFSSDGIEVFMVRAQAPSGTPLDGTEQLFQPIEKLIAALPAEELDTYASQIGIHRDNPNDPFTKRGSHYAQAKVYLHPESLRERTAAQIIEQLREDIGEEHGFERVFFARLNPGPPVGKPVMVRFSADEFETLESVDDMARAEMAALRVKPRSGIFDRFRADAAPSEPVPGIRDIESDLEPGKKELRILVNDRAAADAGVSAADIAMSVRGSFDGLIATKIRTLDEEIDIKVLFPEKDRNRGTSVLEDVRVPNRRGYLIPLSTLATVGEAVGFASIKHSDGKRTVTVSADIYDDVTSAVEVNRVLRPKIEERLAADFPGVTADFGAGEVADTQESFIRLFRSFGLAAALIFLILATVFNSLTRPWLAMLSIPLAGCGVIFAFFVHGQPLGFMTMMGTIGMAGVVVNNSIVFIQFVNRHQRDDGKSVKDAIIEAARIRLRPMLLTSVTTLVGLMPVAYGIGGSDPFVRPMALALSWGVAFSLVMTLLTLPAMIAIMGDIESIPGRVMRVFLGPELVEQPKKKDPAAKLAG